MYDQSYIFLTYLFQNFAQRLPNVCPEAVQSLQINKNSNFKKTTTKDIISSQQQKQQNRTKCFEVYIERKVGHLALGSEIKLHES